MSPLPAGSRLGRFRISSVLGQGAMGVVYLADDPEIGRPVAIKTVRPGAADAEGAAELEARFLKEARLAGRLQHPNIVTIYDVGRDGDVCFIAMEYVDGRPLSRYMGASPELPLPAKVGIVRQVADALAHAHDRGVLHRDIKPGNILIARDGRVKVTDFGIGKFTAGTTSDLTRSGTMLGSPAYMSPEQIRGDPIDGRSDLFSLGVVFYELLTGARPFPGESITTLVYQILHTEPRDPLEVRAGLPPSTREVMARLLAKQPGKRPADAREFAAEIRRIARFQRESEMTRRAVAAGAAEPSPPPGRPPAIVPPSPGGAPSPPPRRGPRVAAVAVAVVLVAIVLALRGWERRQHAQEAGLRRFQRRLALPTAPPAPVSPPPATSIAAAPARPAEIAVEATPPPPAESIRARPEPRAAASRMRTRPAGRVASPQPAPASPAPPRPAGPGTASAAVPPAAPARPDRVDAEYRTRRSVRFTSSPEQARLFVDGRYIGIADDWDNRGGGRPFEFDRPGTHYVRMELAGYRTLVLQVDVEPSADGDSVSIDEELERRSRMPYDKLSAPADRTTGAVDFEVEPPETVVLESGKVLGTAAGFGPGSPLVLQGPLVHDLVLTAPGYTSRNVRVLVASNAGRDRAHIRAKLKKP
jgi:predicted Ser/Thr protein kinase